MPVPLKLELCASVGGGGTLHGGLTNLGIHLIFRWGGGPGGHYDPN